MWGEREAVLTLRPGPLILDDCEFPLLTVVVAGQNPYSQPDHDQTNIALSVLCGFICQRTDPLCTCTAEHSSGAEVTSDS